MKPINGKGNFHFSGYSKELYLESIFELNQYDNGLIKVTFSLERSNENWNKIGAIQNNAYDNKVFPIVSLIGDVYNPIGKIIAEELSIEYIDTGQDKEDIILDGSKKIEINFFIKEVLDVST